MNHFRAIVVGRRAVLAAGFICAVAPAARAQGGDPVPAAVYVRPGDRVMVRLLGESLVSDTVMVNDRGSIVLPRIGVADVSHIDVRLLPDSVRAMYGRLLRTPAVEVQVLRRIVVNGEVKRPDVYYVDATTTSLRDVIAHAGGFTDAAKSGSIAIVRNGHTIPVPDWETRPPAEANLQSGDQIVVPRRSWITMNALPAVSTAAVVASILITILRR